MLLENLSEILKRFKNNKLWGWKDSRTGTCWRREYFTSLLRIHALISRRWSMRTPNDFGSQGGYFLYSTSDVLFSRATRHPVRLPVESWLPNTCQRRQRRRRHAGTDLKDVDRTSHLSPYPSSTGLRQLSALFDGRVPKTLLHTGRPVFGTQQIRLL